MRLWHSNLIPYLDGRRLCDLHMSCCNLRGRGWGKRNVSINYLYDDPLGEDALAVYHRRVLLEMHKRGYNYQVDWLKPTYCGKLRNARPFNQIRFDAASQRLVPLLGHTDEILQNDIKALRERGLDIKF